MPEVTPAISSPQKNANASVASVKALFAEVGSLANQLRRPADEADSVRLGGKAILEVLGEDGALTVPEIARVRATSRQNVQILVNRLEAEECVELASNPAHQRSALVRITERGRVLLNGAKREEGKSLERLLPHVLESELVAAAAILRRVRGLLAAGDGVSEVVRRDGSGPKRETPSVGKGGPLRVTDPRSDEGRAVVVKSPAKAATEADDEDFPVNLL